MSHSELQALFKRHARPLSAYLNNQVHDAQLAADLMQESFVRLTEQFPQGKIQDCESWLYRTARNLLYDHFRQQQRQPLTLRNDAEIEEFPDAGPQPERLVIDHQQALWIHKTLATLPPRTQTIFRLSRFDGLSQGEIATTLRVSLSTVEKHLARALAKLMSGINHQ